MKLSITTRTASKKSEAKVLRREGRVPAIVYQSAKAGEPIAIDLAEFQTHLRKITAGHLPTTVFTLSGTDNKECRAIIKEIQYHKTTYDILHLDFEKLEDNMLVNVKIPIRFLGAEDSPGVKLGGVLRQVIRHLKVRCLPKHLPSSFDLDVSDLGPMQSKRLSAITIPDDIQSLVNLDEVAAIIAKR